MVSFIQAGKKVNGTVEYVLEENELHDFINPGDCVIKPHPRYRIDGHIILPALQLKRLLDED